MIDVNNDFVEEHIAQLIDMQMKEISWKYDYQSSDDGKNKHWHVLGGHNIDECNQNGFEFASSLILKKGPSGMHPISGGLFAGFLAGFFFV